MLDFVHRRWLWLLPLLIIAPASLFSAALLEAYFRSVELPALVRRAGGQVASCGEHQSVLPHRAPKTCELAQTESAGGGEVHETFYFHDGSKGELHSQNGSWKSARVNCTTQERQGSLVNAGMLLLFVAVCARPVRTRQFFYFPGMKRHPMNDFESLAGIYGVCLLAAGFVGFGGSECIALGSLR